MKKLFQISFQKLALRTGIFLLLIFNGCTLGLDSSPKTYFRLSANTAPQKAFKSRSQRLGIRDVLSSGFVESRKVLFSRIPGEIGYYQYSNWVELPSRELTDSLLLAFEKTKIFKSVSRIASGAISDYQLNAELMDFTHYVGKSETSVHVTLRAELIDLSSRDVVASKDFEIIEPVKSDDVDGAVQGFNSASTKLIAQVEDWIDQSLR